MSSLAGTLLAATLLSACAPRQGESPPPPPSETPVAPTPQVVPSEGLEADRAATLAFLEGRPLYERPLGEGLEVPAGLASLPAESCGACHTAIYEEWRVSTHAAAWEDPQYQAEIQKSGNRWLCLNCHTPLLTQQDYWPRGLQGGDVEAPVLSANPAFDAELRREGITCAACHVRGGVIVGPGLLESQPPHPVQADSDFQGNGLCLRCHQAVATYPNKGFVCTFETGSEWEAGPYPAEGRGCPDCHMPPVERPASVGGPERVVRSHWWRGAGIPKFEGVHPPPEANPPGLDLDASWEAEALRLTLTNQSAGHLLPTGDPERWIQVDVTFYRGEEPLGEPWSARIGQTWEWWPTPRKLADNRLAPREERLLSVPAPDGATSALIRASSHRMSEETAAYHHLEGYPLSVETHRAELLRP